MNNRIDWDEEVQDKLVSVFLAEKENWVKPASLAMDDFFKQRGAWDKDKRRNKRNERLGLVYK